MRLAIRKAGSTRLLQLLAVASSPPDKPLRSYLIRMGAAPLVGRCCENITSRQKLPFHTEKLHCARIFGGHDSVLIARYRLSVCVDERKRETPNCRAKHQLSPAALPPASRMRGHARA